MIILRQIDYKFVKLKKQEKHSEIKNGQCHYIVRYKTFEFQLCILFLRPNGVMVMATDFQLRGSGSNSG
jgi:hypothetical protein